MYCDCLPGSLHLRYISSAAILGIVDRDVVGPSRLRILIRDIDMHTLPGVVLGGLPALFAESDYRSSEM